jgi:hypothetical protein
VLVGPSPLPAVAQYGPLVVGGDRRRVMGCGGRERTKRGRTAGCTRADVSRPLPAAVGDAAGGDAMRTSKQEAVEPGRWAVRRPPLLPAPCQLSPTLGEYAEGGRGRVNYPLGCLGSDWESVAAASAAWCGSSRRSASFGHRCMTTDRRVTGGRWGAAAVACRGTGRWSLSATRPGLLGGCRPEPSPSGPAAAEEMFHVSGGPRVIPCG